jgi:hypothetical protein
VCLAGFGRSVFRFWFPVDARGCNFGFRVVLAPILIP